MAACFLLNKKVPTYVGTFGLFLESYGVVCQKVDPKKLGRTKPYLHSALIHDLCLDQIGGTGTAQEEHRR